jgi:hypothetical protein
MVLVVLRAASLGVAGIEFLVDRGPLVLHAVIVLAAEEGVFSAAAACLSSSALRESQSAKAGVIMPANRAAAVTKANLFIGYFLFFLFMDGRLRWRRTLPREPS